MPTIGTYLAFVSSLHNWCVDSRDCIGEGRKVREQHPVRWELVPQDVKQHEMLRREEFGCSEVGCKGDGGEDRPQKGRGGEDGIEEGRGTALVFWRLGAELEVAGDERVGYRLVQLGKVAGRVDGDEALQRFVVEGRVANHVVSEVVLFHCVSLVQQLPGFSLTSTSIARKKHGSDTTFWKSKILPASTSTLLP
jgi:hypothetical protein